MAGTAISILSISLLAMQSQGAVGLNTHAALVGLLQALSSALLMNVAIVGINQLFDIDIDKVSSSSQDITWGSGTDPGNCALAPSARNAGTHSRVRVWPSNTP